MRSDAQPETYVYVTEEGVTRHYGDGSVEALAWEDVVEVRVSADGEDVYFVLLDRHGDGCVVPRSATDAGFLVHLRHLPEFDLERLGQVLGDDTDSGIGSGAGFGSGSGADRDANIIVWRSPELLAPPDPDFP